MSAVYKDLIALIVYSCYIVVIIKIIIAVKESIE